MEQAVLKMLRTQLPEFHVRVIVPELFSLLGCAYRVSELRLHAFAHMAFLSNKSVADGVKQAIAFFVVDEYKRDATFVIKIRVCFFYSPKIADRDIPGARIVREPAVVAGWARGKPGIEDGIP